MTQTNPAPPPTPASTPAPTPAGGAPERSLARKVQLILGKAEDAQTSEHPVAQSLKIQLEALVLLHENLQKGDPRLEDIKEQIKSLSKLQAGFIESTDDTEVE